MFFVNLLETNLKTTIIGKKIMYYTITESTNDDLWSYNSKDSLMDSSETYKFLQDSGVI